MRQLSLTQARAQLSTLVADVDKGKGPVAIAQRSKIKAVLVDAEWHGRVEEELSHYPRVAKQSPLKLRGSMKLVAGCRPSARRASERTRGVLRKTGFRSQVIYVTDTHPYGVLGIRPKATLGKTRAPNF